MDSVTNSGFQCTDFFMPPDGDAVRSVGPCVSDPDPFGTCNLGSVSGFVSSMLLTFERVRYGANVEDAQFGF